MVKFVWTEEVIQELINLYSQGNSCEKIAKLYGCTGGTIAAKLKAKGINTSFKIRTFTTEEIDKIHQYYIVENHSAKDSAKYFGLSLSMFMNVVNKYNLNKDIELHNKLIADTKLKRYNNKGYHNVDKMKSTKLAKYGTEGYNNPEQIRKTKSEKYNDETYCNVKKSNQTKRINNSFNRSNPEEHIYIKLKEVFIDVKRQYSSDVYPFNCDFYIPSLNLYIEYQGLWTHGHKPFENTDEDLKILQEWQKKSKYSEFYKNAIDIWTIKDPLKRKTALENNLNWIEFFTEEDLFNWLNLQKGLFFDRREQLLEKD